MTRYLAMNRYIGVDSHRKEEASYSLQLKGLRPLINHVSAEGLTTKRMISSEKNSPPTDSNKNVYILSIKLSWSYTNKAS